MEAIINLLIVLSFLAECGVLVYFEKKIWNTIYTPLTFLLLPYTLVLFVTIIISGRFGFVEFYYPSILIWNIGAFIFFIPSVLLGLYFNKRFGTPTNSVEPFRFNKFFIFLVQFLILVMMFRFVSVLNSSASIMGSDEFAEDYCGSGIWGHLRVLSTAFLMLLVYSVNKKHRIYWVYIIFLLFINILYQVKGWVIIPCVAGIALRLYTKKTKLKASLVTKIFIVGFIFFQLSYLLIMVVAGESEFGMDFFDEISIHFLHYFTSGTFGLSMDAQLGFPDSRQIDYVLVPFFNIANLFTGDEMISPINPLYLNPGWSVTNVRTFFGTLFINTTLLQGIIYLLVLSSISYGLRIISVVTRNIMLNMTYMFICSLLCMGWFEFYFFHLDVIEIPLFLLLFLFFQKASNYFIADNKIDKIEQVHRMKL